MASPSEHKEGLRCSEKKIVSVKKSPEARFPGPASWFEECGGLILEQHEENGLGIRCARKRRTITGILLGENAKCDKFHPLEVLLSQAMEQGLLGPEQLERIRKAVACPEQTRGNEAKFENSREEEMATVSTATVDYDLCTRLENLVRGHVGQIKSLMEFKEDESEKSRLGRQANLALQFMSHIKRLLELGFNIEVVATGCYKLEIERISAGRLEKVEIDVNLAGRKVEIRCVDPVKDRDTGISYYQCLNSVERLHLQEKDRGESLLIHCDNRSWIEFGVNFDYKGVGITA